MRPEAKQRLAIQARLREARKAKGLTQAQVAIQADLAKQTIALAEQQGSVTWKTASRIGAVLGLDPAMLMINR